MIKRFISILLFINATTNYFSQISSEWKEKEIENANTVEDISYLNEIEKEAVVVLNLARLYPKKFVQIELKNYTGLVELYGDYLSNSRYKTSLIRTMNSMKPIQKLYPDSTLNEFAKCFAKETSENGIVGHKRINCEDGYFAECCSYGMFTGKQIIIQLLIDHDVPSLGHRKICLDKEYQFIGVSESTHSKYSTCCVIDIK